MGVCIEIVRIMPSGSLSIRELGCERTTYVTLPCFMERLRESSCATCATCYVWEWPKYGDIITVFRMAPLENPNLFGAV